MPAAASPDGGGGLDGACIAADKPDDGRIGGVVLREPAGGVVLREPAGGVVWREPVVEVDALEPGGVVDRAPLGEVDVLEPGVVDRVPLGDVDVLEPGDVVDRVPLGDVGARSSSARDGGVARPLPVSGDGAIGTPAGGVCAVGRAASITHLAPILSSSRTYASAVP